MTEGASSDDDDGGYIGYVPSTTDLGASLMVGAVFAFVIGYGVILPFFVALSRRREARRKAAERTFLLEDSEEENEGRCAGDANVNQVIVDTSHIQEDNSNSNSVKKDEDGTGSVARSTQSSASSRQSSVISSAVAAILDHPQVPKSKAGRKRRRRKEMEKQQLTRWSGDKNGSTSSVSMKSSTLMQGIYPGGIPQQPGDEPDQIAFASRNESDGGCGEEVALVLVDANANSQEDVTPSDKYSPPPPPRPKYGSDFNSLGVLDQIAAIFAWDVELKRIIRLSTPYCTQAFITGLTDILNVAVIGQLIGTREVSAYVIVNLLVELTSDFVGGLHEALATLCSQAIGAKNKTLAGEYVQIVVILYTIFFIPFMIIWAIYMDATLEWLGFDEETVRIGKQYTYILIFDLLIDGLGEAIHGLLDVGGLERFSTLIGGVEEILAFFILLFVALFGNPDLVTVGLIQLLMGVLFLVLNIFIIYWKGWFKPYAKGMLGTFALLNGKAVWLVCHTGLSLSLGMLLTDGEWEILTIFASFLGPAEVAAWGILDTVWSGLHELIDGLADASEVRCAHLLGAGEPDRAKLSAYKSMMVGTFAALFLTSLIYICGDDLPSWLTSDPALQHLLSELLPLFGLASIVMALDTMSWTLLGSQGRYRLATVIVCLSSWLVTIPLAVLFSVHLKVNLEGQMTAFFTGYLVMGITHSYFLLQSDWDFLSMKVMEDNEAVRLRDQEMTITSNSSPISAPSASMTSGASRQSPMLPMEVASGRAIT